MSRLLIYLLPLLLLLSTIFPTLTAQSSKCATDDDCSLNGLCSRTTGLCTCDPGWRSADCSELDLRPARRSSGYNLTAQGTSSWGGKVVHDPTDPQLFHLFAAEFTAGCGLDYWSPMSRVIRAESRTGPAGPYTFAAEVVGTFAHNPTVVWSANTSQYLLYHIGCPIPQPTHCTPPAISCDGGNAENGESGISLWTSPDLRNWTAHGMVFKADVNRTWDTDTTNPSPFPLHSPDDPTPAVLLAYRGCPYNCDGAEQINLALAFTPTGPYHRLQSLPLFPNGNEDPFVWRDRRGHYHLLLHSLEPGGGFGDGPKVGRHAFARDIGGPWHFVNRTLAFNWTVQWTDGTETEFYRRERPQLYFSEDGLVTPLYLSNGVQQRSSPQSYTVIQPLGPAAAYEESLGFTSPAPATPRTKKQQRKRKE